MDPHADPFGPRCLHLWNWSGTYGGYAAYGAPSVAVARRQLAGLPLRERGMQRGAGPLDCCRPRRPSRERHDRRLNPNKPVAFGGRIAGARTRRLPLSWSDLYADRSTQWTSKTSRTASASVVVTRPTCGVRESATGTAQAAIPIAHSPCRRSTEPQEARLERVLSTPEDRPRRSHMPDMGLRVNAAPQASDGSGGTHSSADVVNSIISREYVSPSISPS